MNVLCTCDPGTVENGWMETRCAECLEIEIRAWARVLDLVPRIVVDLERRS